MASLLSWEAGPAVHNQNLPRKFALILMLISFIEIRHKNSATAIFRGQPGITSYICPIFPYIFFFTFLYLPIFSHKFIYAGGKV